jgi:hypothetical protein
MMWITSIEAIWFYINLTPELEPWFFIFALLAILFALDLIFDDRHYQGDNQ